MRALLTGDARCLMLHPAMAFLETRYEHIVLAYYWDHLEELDHDIARRLEYVDQVRAEAGPSPLVARLKAQGLL